MDDQYVRNVSHFLEAACMDIENDDQWFALVLMVDPTGEIGERMQALQDAEWQIERAKLSTEELAALDEAVARGIERGIQLGMLRSKGR